MSYRVLVVDDEPSVRQFVATALEASGYAVQTAVNGPDAVELCRDAAFDLILSDVRMPGMDGHELARWVAGNLPGTRTALMTGFDSPCEQCPHHSRCSVLDKPFGLAGLVGFVQRVLDSPAPQPSRDLHRID